MTAHERRLVSADGGAAGREEASVRLYFLRHGQAGNPDEWPHEDNERPLTKRGIAETAAAAQGMRWLNLRIALVLSSPYVRAHQTALITAGELGLGVQTVDGLAPGCSLTTLAETLAAHLPDASPDDEPAATPMNGEAASALKRSYSVLLVGHEPDFSELIGAMIGRKGAAEVQVKKGALCRVDLDPSIPGWRWSAANLRGSGDLAWLLTAKQLCRLGGAD
jgi:phosphohistidine phosphatase